MQELIEVLEALRRRLPEGTTFLFEPEGEDLWIERIEIPPESRGIGKNVLAEIFHACDVAGVECHFVADATDRPDDPVTFDLVNLYRRFGANPVASEDGWPDGWVEMRRPPGDRTGGVLALLEGYEEARRRDLTQAEFDRIREPSGPGRNP